MDNIKITIDTNAEETAKSFEDLANSLNNTENEAVDLRKQIKGLKDELYKLTPGTEEYAKVLDELGNKMDQYKDTQEELRVATGGSKEVFQASTQALASLASGFTAAAGVITLFGGENENLQKTFVKLQAMMSIMNGLQGFAGFGKSVNKAVVAIRSFVNGLKTDTVETTINTAALNKNTAALEVNTIESEKTAASKGILSNAFSKLTTVVTSLSPAILAVGAALAAIVAMTIHVIRHTNEVRDRYDELNETMNSLSNDTRTFTEKQKDLDSEMQKQVTLYARLGASEKTLNEIQKNYYTQQLRNVKAMRDAAVEEAKLYENTNKFREEFDKAIETIKETTDRIKELEQAISDLDSSNLPGWLTNINEDFSNFDRGIARSLARGEITQGTALKKEIQKRKDFLDEITQLEEDYNSGSLDRMQKAADEARRLGLGEGGGILGNAELLASRKDAAQKEIDDFTTQLENYYDNLSKTSAEASKKLAEDHAKNAKKLNEDFEKDYDEIYKSVSEFDNKIQELFESFGFTDPANQGKMRSALQVMLKEIDKFAEDSRKKAEELVSTNQISYSAFALFIDNLNEKVREMRDLANHYSKDIGLTDTAVVLNNSLKRDVKDLTSGLAYINQLYKDGLISREEYNKAYIDKVEGFKTIMASEQEDIEELYANLLNPEYLDEVVNTLEDGSEQTLREFLDSQKMTAEEYVEFLKNLFAQSGAILPPELAKTITDETVKIIDSQFKAIEKKYSDEMAEMSTNLRLESTAWLQGRTLSSSDTGVIWQMMFGVGKSPGQAFDDAQKQAKDTYDMLVEQYNEEKALLEEKMALLDENSEAYKKYQEDMKQIQRDLDKAQADFNEKQVENAEEYAARIVDAATSTFDAVSGLSSAMGSYYHEQAEQARDTYGEQSAEYQKYLKKEGAMKIHQVWADFATGVMKTWAGYADFGPLTYVLAGIQTAALLATAIASTQQINRETKAGTSGGSTANVTGITDRVIFGQEQNADQRAQLNADYNQGATRVFVVESDINDAQNKSRTAVVNNKF